MCNLRKYIKKSFKHPAFPCECFFIISKTQMIAQKQPGRQLNTKVCSSKPPFFHFFLQQKYLKIGSSTHMVVAWKQFIP